MDAIAGLLDGPHARGAALLRPMIDPPWSLRIEDGAMPTLVAIVRGEAWIVPGAGGPTQLGPGDTAIVGGPDPDTVAGEPAKPPQVLIGPDQECRGAGLLREHGATVGPGAPQVGDGSAFALGTAVARLRGVSPRQHRGSAA